MKLIRPRNIILSGIASAIAYMAILMQTPANYMAFQLYMKQNPHILYLITALGFYAGAAVLSGIGYWIYLKVKNYQ